MKRLPLSLLALCLVGCVTVQPCVCPTATTPRIDPGPGIPAQMLPFATAPGEPWFDGCNWHYPITATTESTTLVNCAPVVTPTPSARERRER